jgi:SAM-dependent methyltransferase
MAEINLLYTLAQTTRPLDERAAANEEDRRLAKLLSREYFDGTRAQGYGGYIYDGRWRSVARTFIERYDLKPGARILDIGCAKGFLLYEFTQELSGVQVCGLDISEYAVTHCHPAVRSNLIIGNGSHLPFPDSYFDLVISINSLHNILKYDEVKSALSEIERVSRGHKYVNLGAYRNDHEKQKLDRWAVAATTYLHTDDWKKMFNEAGYTGDYFWFNP